MKKDSLKIIHGVYEFCFLGVSCQQVPLNLLPIQNSHENEYKADNITC